MPSVSKQIGLTCYSVLYLQNGTSGNLRNPPHMAEICHLPGLPQFGTFLNLGHFQVEWLNKLQGAWSIATRPFSNTCKGEVNDLCLSDVVQGETFQAKHGACFLGES